MARFAFALFEHFPARFIAMEKRFGHLPFVEHRHQRVKHPYEALPSISDCARRHMYTVMRQLRTEAGGWAAREVVVQQHHRPHRHP